MPCSHALRRRRRFRPAAHVEHPTRAERDLGHPRLDASLADERRLLVADEAADRWAAGEGGRLADDVGRVDQPREQSGGHAEHVEHAPAPLASVEREEAGDRGVGVVGDVQRATRQ